MKAIEWLGSSKDDLRDFPPDARTDAGYALRLVQDGKEPMDWKPMSTIGLGVNEIRVRDGSGAYRVIYVAKFAGKVFVLHCFQKKTQKTSQHDIEIAKQRFKEIGT